MVTKVEYRVEERSRRRLVVYGRDIDFWEPEGPSNPVTVDSPAAVAVGINAPATVDASVETLEGTYSDTYSDTYDP